jgi:hypothetical protein
MWFDPGLAELFITSTLLHLGVDIKSFGHVNYPKKYRKNDSIEGL